ncbi:pentapeptide repeat-containing protein [Streptomyces sp. NPDC007126]|uniref:pentapeptide repeat-containing protein n=1 Tax=Streptomyces sp. NPDC007126 TaxID=3364774 RepID=UPI0036923FBD
MTELLDAVRDPADANRPNFGAVRFLQTPFADNADFDRANFDGGARFSGARFGYGADFGHASFGDTAWFDGASFGNGALFSDASFRDEARFDGASFGDEPRFDRVSFGDSAIFHIATFGKRVWFGDAKFGKQARFQGARFGEWSEFVGAKFHGVAWFTEAIFGDKARFTRVVFGDDAYFDSATFRGGFLLIEARFRGRADFRSVSFDKANNIGPLVCSGPFDLSGATFGGPVTVGVAASRLVCRRTRWASTGAIWVRYANVDLSDAVFEYPLIVAYRPRAFQIRRKWIYETQLMGLNPVARIASIRGVDAAHLVLNGLDLSSCLFGGAVHLDQLRLEGDYTLPTPPPKRWRLLPSRWTTRHVLAEESHWRASHGYRGWQAARSGTRLLTPRALTAIYRQLRKGLEDSKDEPGAADFYYGEMEMRRKDRRRPWGERALLWLYWAVSGYGLRAGRALAWLVLAMGLTLLGMMAWGLPKGDPKPESTGKITGARISLTTDIPDPVNPDGPYLERFTGERFEKSLQVVINSVVFRSSGQNLTTVGTYIEMASRVAEPVVLGLAALAVRGRVKR